MMALMTIFHTHTKPGSGETQNCTECPVVREVTNTYRKVLNYD